MTRIALIGGHGKVALLAAPLLVADGHEVSSIIRNPDHTADVNATGATAVVANVENLSVPELTALLSGHDVVVWCAGAGGGSPERTYAVDRDAAIRSMEAAGAAGTNHYVMVSYLGSSLNHDVPQENPFFHYAQAKAEADEQLRRSGLRWTILMPSTLTAEPDRTTMNPQPTGAGPTARSLVAQVISAVINSPDAAAARDIPLTDGDVPVAQGISRN